jgi:hypothetical protein
MKNTLSLLLVIFCFLLSGITANAQAHKPVQVIIPDQVIRGDYSNSPKGDKDTARQKEIIIMQKRLGDKQKDFLDIQKELKDIQSLKEDQMKAYAFTRPEDPGTALNMMQGFSDDQLGMFGFLQDASKESSQLTLSKSFTKGESLETTKKFTVSSTFTVLNMTLKGQVKTGAIAVTLIKPNGNKFKSIVIDPTSDVSFSFNHKLDTEKDPKEWTGDWQINIKADKADGNYRLNIMTR